LGRGCHPSQWRRGLGGDSAPSQEIFFNFLHRKIKTKYVYPGRAPKARVSRRRRRRRRRGLERSVSPSPMEEGSGEGTVPLSRKIFNFLARKHYRHRIFPPMKIKYKYVYFGRSMLNRMAVLIDKRK